MMSTASCIANRTLIEAIRTCYTFYILYIRCFANPTKWWNGHFSKRFMESLIWLLIRLKKIRGSLSFPLMVRVIPFFKNIFKSAAEMISFNRGSRGLIWNNLWAYVKFIQRWTIYNPRKTGNCNDFGNCDELKSAKWRKILATQIAMTIDDPGLDNLENNLSDQMILHLILQNKNLQIRRFGRKN